MARLYPGITDAAVVDIVKKERLPCSEPGALEKRHVTFGESKAPVVRPSRGQEKLQPWPQPLDISGFTKHVLFRSWAVWCGRATVCSLSVPTCLPSPLPRSSLPHPRPARLPSLWQLLRKDAQRDEGPADLQRRNSAHPLSLGAKALPAFQPFSLLLCVFQRPLWLPQGSGCSHCLGVRHLQPSWA